MNGQNQLARNPLCLKASMFQVAINGNATLFNLGKHFCFKNTTTTTTTKPRHLRLIVRGSSLPSGFNHIFLIVHRHKTQVMLSSTNVYSM